MIKQILTLIVLIIFQSDLVSQSSEYDENIFVDYFGSVDINLLAGTYNDPLTINASEIN